MMSDYQHCTCEVCMNACTQRPGWFRPGEAEIAAAAIGMTFEQFFVSYLGIDYWEADGDFDQTVFLLAPATTHMTAGGEYPTDPRGRCRLLDDGNRCMIHGSHPFECRMYNHDDSGEAVQNRRCKVARAWETHQDQIQTLIDVDG